MLSEWPSRRLVLGSRRRSWHPNIDSGESAQPLGFFAFALEEVEREVDPLDLPEPALSFGARSSSEEIGLYLLQSIEHLGVDAEHRAPDAGVLVTAWGRVGASAIAQFELALVEVLLEFGPLGVGDWPVFLLGPHCASTGQVLW